MSKLSDVFAKNFRAFYFLWPNLFSSLCFTFSWPVLCCCEEHFPLYLLKRKKSPWVLFTPSLTSLLPTWERASDAFIFCEWYRAYHVLAHLTPMSPPSCFRHYSDSLSPYIPFFLGTREYNADSFSYGLILLVEIACFWHCMNLNNVRKQNRNRNWSENCSWPN